MLLALLPRGRVWSRDPTTTQNKALAGLAPTYAQQTARASNLLVDAFPSTAVELLPEWEATLGLPSVAAGPAPSILARQTLVAARFIGAGGQTISAFKRYAGMLGFDISIVGQAPFRCGQSWCGQSLGGQEQMFGWTVTASAATATAFGDYGIAVLESELLRIVPPYSVLNFNIT